MRKEDSARSGGDEVAALMSWPPGDACLGAHGGPGVGAGPAEMDDSVVQLRDAMGDTSCRFNRV